MIRYALKCGSAHRFEAWFGSSQDYDRLKAAGHVACAVCGSIEVDKDVMAPAVSTPAKAGAPDLSAPASAAEQAVAALRAKVEALAENVGRGFAREARRIHAGEAPERPIWGESRPAEARALIEDGIPIAPLPWSPRKPT